MNSIDPKRIRDLYPVGTVVLYNGGIYAISGYTRNGKKLKSGSKTLQLDYHCVYFLSRADVSVGQEKMLLKYLRIESADSEAELIYKSVYVGEPI